MDIYLDIDGVILANDKQMSNYSQEFIKHLVDNYNVYWLTTHCRGNVLPTCELLQKFFDEKTMVYIHKILPTYWETNKTEAIDFSKPFLWFDDDLFKEEREVLVKNNCLNSWIEIDFDKDENQLAKYLDI